MKREEEEKNAAKTQALTTQPKPKILPPASKVPALPLDASMTSSLDLAEFERQIKTAARMLNLSVPEGLLDRVFDRPDHRIEVKTERGRRLAGYVSACTAILEAARMLQDARRQPYLDQLVFLRRMAEEQNNLEAVTSRSRLQGQIEEAKARAEIARHEADAREAGLRGRPAPPQLPPPPVPAPVDEATRKREEIRRKRQEMLDLELQELDLKTDAGQEKVTRAKAKAIQIFQDVNLSAGEVLARIQEVLDGYGLDYTILPRRIQDFMEAGLDGEGAGK